MLDRDVWGQGYALESGQAVLDYGFKELGRSELISLIRPENTRSIRLAGRLGASNDGQVDLLGGSALVFKFRRGNNS